MRLCFSLRGLPYTTWFILELFIRLLQKTPNTNQIFLSQYSQLNIISESQLAWVTMYERQMISHETLWVPLLNTNSRVPIHQPHKKHPKLYSLQNNKNKASSANNFSPACSRSSTPTQIFNLWDLPAWDSEPGESSAPVIFADWQSLVFSNTKTTNPCITITSRSYKSSTLGTTTHRVIHNSELALNPATQHKTDEIDEWFGGLNCNKQIWHWNPGTTR